MGKPRGSARSMRPPVDRIALNATLDEVVVLMNFLLDIWGILASSRNLRQPEG
jgi:hypothetical protein